MVCLSRLCLVWDDFGTEPPIVAIKKAMISCEISTQIGKTCQAAIQFCFVSYVKMEGAGRASMTAGTKKPSASEKGMLSNLEVLTAKSSDLGDETLGEVERWIARWRGMNTANDPAWMVRPQHVALRYVNGMSIAECKPGQTYKEMILHLLLSLRPSMYIRLHAATA